MTPNMRLKLPVGSGYIGAYLFGNREGCALNVSCQKEWPVVEHK